MWYKVQELFGVVGSYSRWNRLSEKIYNVKGDRLLFVEKSMGYFNYYSSATSRHSNISLGGTETNPSHYHLSFLLPLSQGFGITFLSAFFLLLFDTKHRLVDLIRGKYLVPKGDTLAFGTVSMCRLLNVENAESVVEGKVFVEEVNFCILRWLLYKVSLP